MDLRSVLLRSPEKEWSLAEMRPGSPEMIAELQPGDLVKSGYLPESGFFLHNKAEVLAAARS